MLSEGRIIKNNNNHKFAKISVIIVTRNVAPTLQKCLDSIYRQKYPNIELVIIDGGSTDGTVKILEYNSDNIFYWKSEPDKGIYDAMNKALKHITGQWVYFIGADDELYDDFSVMAFELEQPNAIYYANVFRKDKVFNGRLNDYAIAKYGVYHQAIIYPKTVFDQLIYNIKYIVRADHVLNLQSVKAGFRFIYKDYIIANFHHLGISNNYVDVPFEKDQAALVFRNFSFKIWLRFMFWRFKRDHIKKKK